MRARVENANRISQEEEHLNNHHLVAGSCHGFLRAYEVLRDHIRSSVFRAPGIALDDFGALVVPQVVLIAFATELGLKTLLIQSNKMGDPLKSNKGGEHDLEMLFARLPIDLQHNLATVTSGNRSTFDTKLKLNARAFNQWRYVHESRELSADEEFLERLVRAMTREFESPT
jgi:hypothetical protein